MHAAFTEDKLALGAPENAASTTLLIKAWLELYGWEFVQKLKANAIMETRLQTEAIQAVARGEAVGAGSAGCVSLTPPEPRRGGVSPAGRMSQAPPSATADYDGGGGGGGGGPGGGGGGRGAK